MKISRFVSPILFFLISFASVNAVLPMPALTEIALRFHVSQNSVQVIMSAFLWGYAFGQLLYGPLANRFGRKASLMAGIALQIISSLLCLLSIHYLSFHALVFSRLLMALGAGVGLKMTFTLVNEYYKPEKASQITAWLIIGFAFIPGIMVSLSGYMVSQISWTAPFFLSFVYGLILFILCLHLPETLKKPQMDALKPVVLTRNYVKQLSDISLVFGSLMVGAASCFTYYYASAAPLISMVQFHLSASDYGILNLIPTMGLVIGCILAARVSPTIGMSNAIRWGVLTVGTAVSAMGVAKHFQMSILISLFMPMALINIGLSLIFANATSLILSQMEDKANASAMLHFINMAMAALFIQYTQGMVADMNQYVSYCLLLFVILVLAKQLSYKKAIILSN